MYTIKRVSIGSAFRVGAVSSALVWVVFGILFVLWIIAVGNAFDSAGTQFSGQSNNVGEFSGGAAIFTYLCGIPIYAVIGGISGALYAFIYNLVAGWVGGLELELEQTHYMPQAYQQQQQPPMGGIGGNMGAQQRKQRDDYDPFE